MLRKLSWTFGILIIFAIAVLSGEIGKELVQLSVANFQERRQKAILEETMIEAASAVNAQTPMRVDQATTLVSAAAIGNRLRYTYLIHVDDSGGQWANDRNEQKVRILKFACNDQDMIFLLRNGGSYEYVYINSKNQDVFSLHITNSDCQDRVEVLPTIHLWTDAARATFFEREIAECARHYDESSLLRFLIGERSVEEHCACKSIAKLEIILGDGRIHPPANSNDISSAVKESIQRASGHCFGTNEEK